jgi:hypothetical protein
MTRRPLPGLLTLALLLGLLGFRSTGCQKKPAAGGKPASSPSTQRKWITPLLTQPPPAPTPTLWKGVTRVPQLPE